MGFHLGREGGERQTSFVKVSEGGREVGRNSSWVKRHNDSVGAGSFVFNAHS